MEVKYEQVFINTFQDERFKTQKKIFIKWINLNLKTVNDLADGRILLKLLEIVTGKKLPKPSHGNMRVHKIENVNKSILFLRTQVHLQGIGAEDIVDGSPKLILGLIWTIILRFHIEKVPAADGEAKLTKETLLSWCQKKTRGYPGVEIKNFTDSWRSGLGFSALIHAHCPNLFVYNNLLHMSNIRNLKYAFEVTQTKFDIPKLLDAEDVCISKIDEKSIMTYITIYYHTFAGMTRNVRNLTGETQSEPTDIQSVTKIEEHEDPKFQAHHTSIKALFPFARQIFL
ncbi:alpha-actinin-4-like [Arctopsyche grandis]|uniref:alpha-actinin-4-like n=1 Tax=Arctopsyche grandis TaxID=121162 RepID=UPI00406D94E3